MNTQTLLVAILVVVVFGVGFMIGRMTASEGYLTQQIGSPSTTENTSGDEASSENTAEQSGTSEIQGDAAISTNDLTPGQRKLLESLGINADEVTVTAEMVACAEAKLGAGRVEEIKNGATPSFLEGAQLVACYK